MLQRLKSVSAEFTEYLKTTPVGKAFLAEQAARVREQRRTLIIAIAKIDADDAREQARIDKELAKAAPMLQAAQAAFIEAAATVNRLRGQRRDCYRFTLER